MHSSASLPPSTRCAASRPRKTASISSYGDEEDCLKLEDPEVYDEVPGHWRNNFSNKTLGIGRLQEAFFVALCLVSVGHKSLEQKWRGLSSDEDSYRDHMGRITTRLGTITVMIGLLLASTATLITTQAPSSQIIDYSMRGPCICFWVSFSVLLGAGVVGSTGIFVMTTCTRDWTLNVLLGSRMRLVFILIILAYPFFAVGISTLVCAFGILIAACSSQDPIVRNTSGLLLAFPVLMAVLFVACAMPLKKEEVREAAGST
ncbi:hypothetical protein AURDEDRAFT_170396 [Auricularia subglabra TFB-10046 SS5]|nr:hypothetical protein AURDEDRAFT_170396 [Auricularia subglabra TFB-10046 SS5]